MAKSKPAEKPATPENPVTAVPESPKIETVSASALNDAVEIPTPNERTISSMAEDTATPVPPFATTTTATAAPMDPKPGDLDHAGTPYDPATHEPRKNREGKWAGKPGRRKGGSNAPKPATGKPMPQSVVGDATGGPVAPTIPGERLGDRFDLAAELYTKAGYSMLDGIFNGNGEWLPENDGEHVALRGAVATYLRHKNSDDLPPGLALALAVGTFGAKRISRPNTAMRIRFFGAWIRAKIQGWRNGGRLAELPAVSAPVSQQSPLPPQTALPGNSSSAVDPHAEVNRK